MSLWPEAVRSRLQSWYGEVFGFARFQAVVVFEYTEDGEGLILMYECDSAYADCPDTRRSRYGFLGFLAGGVIVAKTAMFKSVMPSTGAAQNNRRWRSAHCIR